MSKILYVSSEAFPLVKTGGLGDVAGSLPAALLKQGEDVRILLPAYQSVLKSITKSKIIAKTSYYGQPVNIIQTKLPGTRVIVLLVDCPAAFDRPGAPYTDNRGQPWHDNAFRFAIFCLAAVDIALNKIQTGWQPGIVHCNDWQTGLVPALLSLQKKRPKTVFTIHNLAYQGIFSEQTFTDLNLPVSLWNMNGLEYYGQLSFIKGGLAYADKITTVSQNYAKEILQPEYGYGLEGLLKYRIKHLSGIINGIDEKHWNPGTDHYLEHKYNRRSIKNKSLNKKVLQKEFSLPIESSVPMIGMVSRLVEQKGLDIILQSLPILLQQSLQIIILGTGDTHFEIQLANWAQLYPKHLKVIIGYNESLAHKIEASCDLYLMPSTFEPCGLNQLYSLRYGTLPVVTPVGGLADTVINATEKNIASGTANGFVLENKSALALLDAIKRATALYKKPALWQQLQVTAMAGDYSWKTSAENYSVLYAEALKMKTKPQPEPAKAAKIKTKPQPAKAVKIKTKPRPKV